MIRKDFVRAYCLGWYHAMQMKGEYLWDVPYDSFDGEEKKIIEQTAQFQYERNYTKTNRV